MDRAMEEIEVEYKVYLLKQLFMDFDSMIDHKAMTFDEFCAQHETKGV
jgi:hypothetical protein